MSEDVELTCKVFVDSVWSRDEVTVNIARSLNGTVDSNTILTPSGEIDVRRNDDFSERTRFAFPDGFVYFPYVAEFYASPGEGLHGQVASVSTVLTNLWDQDIPAIAACDFADQLPNRGGFRNKSVPWARDLAASHRE